MADETLTRLLPGDSSPAQEVERMIRVDHAGEYGATRIYAGQLAVLGRKSGADAIRHMAMQEAQHLDRFNQLVRERRVRPTALMPLWHVGGWLMGAATALLGYKAAMACTEAVEAVIGAHYAQQERALPADEGELKNTIAQFRAEEAEHHDTALAQGAEQAPFYQLIKAAVGAQTRLAIFLSKRI